MESKTTDKKSNSKDEKEVSNSINEFIAEGKYEGELKIGKWTYSLGDTMLSVTWEVLNSIDDKTLKFNVLKEWEEVKTEKALYYAYLNKNAEISSLEYCTIIKNEAKGLSLKEYMSLSYESFYNDTSEILLGHNIQLLEFQNNKAILGKYETEIDQRKYTTYICYIKDLHSIYDFSYKVENRNMSIFEKTVFGDFVSGFTIRNNSLISLNDQVLQARPVIFHDKQQQKI
ncbi:hypothetical protein FHS59_000082 [Algoriphagus iocasae]|uniref:Uncharacterized protein n=1 Tax=Algoriphagus iocasae TaxID=1836499 RepID=A0A841MG39_9BACT|nr:hypothetical protein [Algoriphagus iocasae]MBB6324467.1 hypothetical protein [Algoriphagus iocasae]